MIYGVTGHRRVDQKAGELDRFARLSVARMICEGATGCITGFALGWDLAVAQACDDLRFPFIAAIPFWGQTRGWTEDQKAPYYRLLDKAARIEVISKTQDTSNYLKRDRWIVDNCVELWALRSGRPSGTETTCLYAWSLERKIVNVWPDWIDFRSENICAESE